MMNTNNNFNNGQEGRSMIEMLGVLAIIGVLSVGGIAGYSKAMMKYRTNKTIEQISMIVTNVRTLFGSQKNYKALKATTQESLVAKAHLFPDELIDTANNSLLDSPNPFGGDIELVCSSRASATDSTVSGDPACGDMKAFLIAYTNIPEEACMDLVTQDWGSASGSGLIVAGADPMTGTTSLTAPTYSAETYKSVLQGCKAKDDSDKLYVCGGEGSMTAAKAASACNGDKNILYLKFY